MQRTRRHADSATAASALALIVMAGVAGLTASAARAAGPLSGKDGWAAFTRCATLTDDASRHACTDQVLRDAGLLSTAVQAPPGQTPHAAPAPPRPVEPAMPPVRPAPAPAPLEVTLAAVEQDAEGRLVLTTSNGSLWRQTDGAPVRSPPERGQPMTITPGALGGYWCQSGKWTAFRCRRVR